MLKVKCYKQIFLPKIRLCLTGTELKSEELLFDGAANTVMRPITPALLKGILHSHNSLRNMGWFTVCFLIYLPRAAPILCS